MKLKVDRYCMYISTESDVEVAYIEEVLGLKKEGDSILLTKICDEIGYNRLQTNELPHVN